MGEETRISERVISRRRLLSLSVFGGAAALLVACGGGNETPSTDETHSAGGGESSGSGGQGTTPAASGDSGDAELADEQVFRYASQEPEDADPGITGSPWSLSELFEGLVVIDPRDGSFIPSMAEKYEPNSDGSKWTFTMRPGVVWSDGTPITAKDFEWSWKRVMDPQTASKYAAIFYPIQNGEEVAKGELPPDELGVKAIDDSTFEVTLKEPTPFFPIIAATWTAYPVPRHVIEKVGNRWLEPENIVVNGPFILTEWKHDQLMVFEPNPNYWGEKPTLTRAEFILYDDATAKGLPAYENDEIDHALVPSSEYDRVREDPVLSKEMQGYPTSSTEQIHFDCSNPPTDDIRVRQALALGFRREPLIKDVLKDYYLPAPTILPDDIPGHNPDAALEGDLEKAKSLLAEAGFPNGQGWPEDFTLVYRNTSPLPLIAQYLQQEWKQNLGITVQLQPMEPRAYVEWRSARETQPYNAHMGIWGSDYSDPSNWHNQLYASNADFYKTHWKNDEFDSIVAKAMTMTDPDARAAEYAKAEEILIREAAHVPIYHGQRFFVTKPYVKDVYHFPTAAAGSWLKYIKIVK